MDMAHGSILSRKFTSFMTGFKIVLIASLIFVLNNVRCFIPELLQTMICLDIKSN